MAPTGPAGPATPAGPTGPVAPVAPGSPGSPWIPATPAGPAGPTAFQSVAVSPGPHTPVLAMILITPLLLLTHEWITWAVTAPECALASVVTLAVITSAPRIAPEWPPNHCLIFLNSTPFSPPLRRNLSGSFPEHHGEIRRCLPHDAANRCHLVDGDTYNVQPRTGDGREFAGGEPPHNRSRPRLD